MSVPGSTKVSPDAGSEAKASPVKLAPGNASLHGATASPVSTPPSDPAGPPPSSESYPEVLWLRKWEAGAAFWRAVGWPPSKDQWVVDLSSVAIPEQPAVPYLFVGVSPAGRPMYMQVPVYRRVPCSDAAAVATARSAMEALLDAGGTPPERAPRADGRRDDWIDNGYYIDSDISPMLLGSWNTGIKQVAWSDLAERPVTAADIREHIPDGVLPRAEAVDGQAHRPRLPLKVVPYQGFEAKVQFQGAMVARGSIMGTDFWPELGSSSALPVSISTLRARAKDLLACIEAGRATAWRDKAVISPLLSGARAAALREIREERGVSVSIREVHLKLVEDKPPQPMGTVAFEFAPAHGAMTIHHPLGTRVFKQVRPTEINEVECGSGDMDRPAAHVIKLLHQRGQRVMLSDAPAEAGASGRDEQRAGDDVDALDSALAALSLGGAAAMPAAPVAGAAAAAGGPAAAAGAAQAADGPGAAAPAPARGKYVPPHMRNRQGGSS